MVLVGLVSFEASLLGLQKAILPCVLTQVVILCLILWSLPNANMSLVSSFPCLIKKPVRLN